MSSDTFPNAPQKSHTIVVGAGIVGVSTAVWLQRFGHRVTLVDRAGIGDATSFGNGGVLAASSIMPVTMPGIIWKAPRLLFDRREPLFLKWQYLPKLLPWLLRYLAHANRSDVDRAMKALHPLISDAAEDHLAVASGTGAERYLKPGDFFFLYGNKKDFEAEKAVWEVKRQYGYEWEEMDGQTFRTFDPGFSKAVGYAVCLKNHGHITDPGAYVKALAAHVINEGGHFIQTEVRDLEIEDDLVTRLITGEGRLHADQIVLTTGAWSGPLATKLGINPQLETERGYHIELHEPSFMPRAPVLDVQGQFVITPMEGRIRLAGILELGGLHAAPSKAPYDLLLRNLKATMPDLGWKRETRWMGHRPATIDSIPTIGRSPVARNAHVGFGHHHVGLTAGPKTGQLLAQMVSGQTPNLDMAAYDPARFG